MEEVWTFQTWAANCKAMASKKKSSASSKSPSKAASKVAGFALTAEQMEDMRKAFDLLDSDKSGKYYKDMIIIIIISTKEIE